MRVAASERDTVDCVGARLTRTRPLGDRAAPHDDPARIDRYVVQRRLGVGGMSVVYEALDERIGRRVALKLMLVGDADSDRQRLRREAQALARVSHPNVVEVFEIGEHEGKAFVAMALVEGEPLDRWLRLQPRRPVEIVEAFLQAGEGLAAAHAHGLVHRDFKPGNVLMGHDGRVRVVDFGLVRETTSVEPSSSAEASMPTSRARISAVISPPSSWDKSLTRTGAMVGTPAYMSPEQFGGLEVGPASDQFSFCVALYEALYGRHPFVVDGHWQQLPYNVLEGRLQRPPVVREVPAMVTKIVLRGLALRPETRWPTMEALLAALRRVLQRRGPRLRSVVMGTGALLLGGMALHGSMHTPEEHHCHRGELIMRRAWSPEVREELREAWLDTGLPGAADTWARVDERLQDKVDDWWGIHHAACSGASPATSSATCLMRWAEGLRKHLQVMERPNESLLHNAVQMVGELPSLDDCNAALEAPPDEPAPEVPPWQEELAYVDALISSGQSEAAGPLVEDLLARAAVEGSAALTAEANLRLGRVLVAHSEMDRAGVAFEEAYFGAKPLGNDRLAAEAALALLQLFGELRYRPHEVARWSGHARAETERLGDPVLVGRYLNAWGRALRSERKLDDALAQHLQALALQESLPSPEPTDLALSHFQIGSVLGLLGRVDEAHAHLVESLRLHEQTLGPNHPRVALSLINLGIFSSMSGHDEEALPLLERAYEIATIATPNNPGSGSFTLGIIAGIHAREGRLEEAASELRRSLDGYQQTHTPEDTDLAMVALYECEAAAHANEHEKALGYCRRALEVERAEPEGNTVDEPSILLVMGGVLARQGRLDAAVEAHVRARTSILPGRTLASDDERRAKGNADHALGRALRVAGRLDEALVALERARVELVEGVGPTYWELRDLDADLGATLLELGRGEEARARLRAAVPAMEEHGGSSRLAFQHALVTLALAELDGGDVALAREHAERALALAEARPVDVPGLSARARFALARCLPRAERVRALALARRAEQQLAVLGEERRELEAVRAWLADHGGRVAPR